ncbi:MAG TPA: zinc-binding dehydrogenase [Candidatus Limnocylindrales bacterium]|nr:zinc-binding dehydrogenase [Candidatus Limnocylindrales bacterium]
MHLIRQYEFGGPETLVVETADDLTPGEGQVRIAVSAAGVHLIDTYIRRGERMGALPLPELPMTPGREVAGTVDAVGPGVPAEWIGAPVVVHLGQANGGYASQAVANVADLFRLSHDRFDEAVVMVGTGRTALGVLEVADLTAGDVVLVTSAAGGLGILLGQAAHHAGASVIAAAGGVHKLANIDAEVKVDYREPGWASGLEPTVVLDGVGGAVGREALEALGVGGRLVIFGWSSGTPTEFTNTDVLRKGLSIAALGPRLIHRPGKLRELAEQSLAEHAAGRFAPVTQHFPLAEAAACHRAIEMRATVGKTVLIP